MSGKKGAYHKNIRESAIRRKVWTSIRILRRFTLPDLCRTSGAKYCNVKTFVRNLCRHGYVAKHGSRCFGVLGGYQRYGLVKDAGPEYPLTCEVCGKSIYAKCEVG